MDIKGFLKLNVLYELREESLTGYALINNIAKKSGKKPSSGSMYPLLKELLDKKLVKFKVDGRKKVYSLTKKGKDKINILIKEKEKSLQNHLEALKHFNDVFDDKKIKEIKSLIKKSHSNSIYPCESFIKLFNTLISLKHKKLNQNKQNKIKKILFETNQKLKKIK